MQRTTARAAIAAAAVIAMGATLVGCTPAENGNDKFVVFAPQDADTDLATNTFTDEMAEEFDLDFDWQTTSYDSGAASEKRQISLASGDYPDAYFLISWVDAFSRTELLKYGQQGVVVPIDELIEEHAPNIKAALEAQPEWAKANTAPDGRIYGLSAWDDCFHCSYPSKMWLNSEWLNTLGLAMPTTTDELRDVLLAFKNDDPNGNGQQDEVPLSGSIDSPIIPYLMNAFTYSPAMFPGSPGSLVLNGDDVEMGATKDEWREGLAYIASLYSEGLIDSGAFTQTNEGLKALGDNADAEILGAATTMHPGVQVTIGSDDGRDKHYSIAPPVAGPAGLDTTTWQPSINPKTVFVLTNKATEEEQVKAIKLLDHIFTEEGTVRGQFGPEGIGWRAPEAGDLTLDPELEPNFAALTYEAKQNEAWRTLAQYYNPLDFRNAQVTPADSLSPEGYERRLYDATLEYEVHKPNDSAVFPFYSLWPSVDDSAELAELQTNLTTFMTQSNAEFITGQRDIASDSAWQDYLNELEGLGLPRFIEIWQGMYDEQN